VVACASLPAASAPAGNPRDDPPGSNRGACDDRNSAKDEDPIYSKETRRPPRSKDIPRLPLPTTRLPASSQPYAPARRSFNVAEPVSPVAGRAGLRTLDRGITGR
jgi:hypothetical protein